MAPLQKVVTQGNEQRVESLKHTVTQRHTHRWYDERHNTMRYTHTGTARTHIPRPTNTHLFLPPLFSSTHTHTLHPGGEVGTQKICFDNPKSILDRSMINLLRYMEHILAVLTLTKLWSHSGLELFNTADSKWRQ